MRIAQRAHRGSVEPTGEPAIAHVSRVAKASPPFARAVAWLHDVFEHSSIREEELLASGLTDEVARFGFLPAPPRAAQRPAISRIST